MSLLSSLPCRWVAHPSAALAHLLAAALLLPAAALAETVEFRFDPPDGTVRLVTHKRTRVTEMGSRKDTDVSEGRERWIFGKTENGYTVRSHILSSSISRNGHPIASPMLTAMAGIEVTYTIDGNGQIQSVEGYRALLGNVGKQFPPQLMQMLTPLFDEGGLIRKDKADWQARIGGLAGKKAEIGETWMATEPFALPIGGSAEVHSATRLDGWTESEGRRCMRLRFAYHSDAAELAKLVGKMAGSPGGSAAESTAGNTEPDPAAVPQPASSLKIVGEGERVIDPATMIIYSEKIVRTLTMEADLPGKGLTAIKVVETREYSTTKADQSSSH